MEYLGAAVGVSLISCDPDIVEVTPEEVTPEFDSLDVFEDLEVSDTFDFFLAISLKVLDVLEGLPDDDVTR